MHSRKAARLDVSAAASDDFFDDLSSSPQTSSGTADEVGLPVYDAEEVREPLLRGRGGGGGKTGEAAGRRRGWHGAGRSLLIISIPVQGFIMYVLY